MCVCECVCVCVCVRVCQAAFLYCTVAGSLWKPDRALSLDAFGQPDSCGSGDGNRMKFVPRRGNIVFYGNTACLLAQGRLCNCAILLTLPMIL